jgi:hypothetical protein
MDGALPDAAVRDAGPPDAFVRDTGTPSEIVPHDRTVRLPPACGVSGDVVCNPLDGAGCGIGELCDLAADGTFQCFEGTAAGASLGGGCEALHGPYCAGGLTCIGTLTGAGTCARYCCADSECAPDEACRPLGATGDDRGSVGACVSREPLPGAPEPRVLSHHPGELQGRGLLVPWTSLRDALAREHAWYLATCPDVGGYPWFASVTHSGGDCAVSGEEVVLALQGGTGILSYLAYDEFTGHADPALLETARGLGDYIVAQGLTPDEGLYPRIPRSTGIPGATPQPPDCGRNSDLPYEIEPDKAGIAGYALARLAAATGEPRYEAAALHIATRLAANMRAGDATRSPWPFRVDYRDGAYRGEVGSNTAFTLRLFDAMIEVGHGELAPPRAALWRWIVEHQIPSASGDGLLWVEFYENHTFPNNRNAWAPLQMARYLMEGREALDPDWRAHTDTLMAFVEGEFLRDYMGFTVCIEQDWDQKPFGGVLSSYAATTARYAAITGSAEHRGRAYTALSLLAYAVDDDGCPNDLVLEMARGGWQQDAHTDKVFNIVDALEAFPAWAD